jgi:hypothetical protein
MPSYQAINDSWPDPCPVPSGPEAIRGTRRLIRKAFALAKAEGRIGFIDYAAYIKRVRFQITSGNRYTGLRGGVWRVNPNGQHFGGWKDIVHGVSHWAGRRWWPQLDPHNALHAWLEAELAAYAIANLCTGKVAVTEKPKADPKAKRAASVARRIKQWRAKERRAKTALRKLARQAKYYGLEVTA